MTSTQSNSALKCSDIYKTDCFCIPSFFFWQLLSTAFAQRSRWPISRASFTLTDDAASFYNDSAN
jgi:hypothetical protein